MLFIPGGDFQYLGASIPPYNCQRFVNTTNIVCVIIQYRLGTYSILVLTVITVAIT